MTLNPIPHYTLVNRDEHSISTTSTRNTETLYTFRMDMHAPIVKPKVYIETGDARSALRGWPDGFANCCVTSPPYFGLRDYGVANQIGLEEHPTAFVEQIVAVFREVRRVLRDDGTLWLNLGDSYANDGKWGGHTGGKHVKALHCSPIGRNKRYTGLKPKDLIGIPWMVAFALRADGWYLRQDIIWHKPNPMPESVRDRCTKAHEYLFLLSKSEKYYIDADAMQEPVQSSKGNATTFRGGAYTNNSTFENGEGGKRTARGNHGRARGVPPRHAPYASSDQSGLDEVGRGGMRNRRSVWTIATKPFKEAHFATFPPALVEPCILAGCPPQGIVIDPFGGAGTTGLVAARNGRHACMIELNPEYAAMARKRIDEDQALT